MSSIYTTQPTLQHYFTSACCIDATSSPRSAKAQLPVSPHSILKLQQQHATGPATLSHSQGNMDRKYQFGVELSASCSQQQSGDRDGSQHQRSHPSQAIQDQQHILNSERLDLTDEDLRVLASILHVDDDESSLQTLSRW